MGGFARHRIVGDARLTACLSIGDQAGAQKGEGNLLFHGFGLSRAVATLSRIRERADSGVILPPLSLSSLLTYLCEQ